MAFSVPIAKKCFKRNPLTLGSVHHCWSGIKEIAEGKDTHTTAKHVQVTLSYQTLITMPVLVIVIIASPPLAWHSLTDPPVSFSLHTTLVLFLAVFLQRLDGQGLFLNGHYLLVDLAPKFLIWQVCRVKRYWTPFLFLLKTLSLFFVLLPCKAVGHLLTFFPGRS